jgi:hypothetical protein
MGFEASQEREEMITPSSFNEKTFYCRQNHYLLSTNQQFFGDNYLVLDPSPQTFYF